MARRKRKNRAEELYNRRVKEAEYYLQEGENVRSVASKFGLSKSQVFQDLCHMSEIGRPDLQKKIDAKLAKNKILGTSKGGKNRWAKRKAEQSTQLGTM